jgi:hypothetical protein
MRFVSRALLAVAIAATLGMPARAQDASSPDDGLPLPATADTSAPTDASATDAPAAPAPDPNDVYGPHPAGTMLAPVRQRVVAIALGEVGKVSDLGGENGFKKGWQRLKQYFDEATPWGPDCFAKGLWVQHGIQHAGENPPGGEWCGIFATWCFEQAGVNARWIFGKGPSLQQRYDKQNLQPGDIGVIAKFSHHFVVVKRDGNTIWTVSGNSSYHGISKDSARSLSEVVAYYRPTEDAWVPNDGTVTPVPAATSAPGGSTPGLAGAISNVAAASSAPASASPTTSPSPSSSGAHPICGQGSSGPAVDRIQTLLQASGATIAMDGYYGPKTAQAVRDFQKSHGCKVDGVVGPETWAALEAAQAPAPAPATPSADASASVDPTPVTGGVCSPDDPQSP